MNTLLSPEHYQAALATDPNDINALYSLGRLARDADDMIEAEAYFNKVVALDANHVGALGNLANLCLARNDAAQAEAYFLRLLNIDPDSQGAHANLMNMYRVQGNAKQEFHHLEQMVRLQPANLSLCIKLADVYRERFQLDDATMVFLKANQAKPDDPKILFQLSESYQERNMYPQAREVLVRCVELDDDYLAAYLRLGYVCNRMQRLDEAITYLTQAIALDDNNAVAWDTLGAAFYMSKRIAEAREAFCRANELSPDKAYILSNLGVAEQSLGMVKESIEHLQRAIELDPECGTNYWNLAHAFMFEQDYAAFKAVTMQSLERSTLKPDEKDDMLCNQAIMLWLEGDVQRCAEVVKECLLRIHNHAETVNRNVFRGYIKFLKALLAFRDGNPELYEDEFSEDAQHILYVIGDSHSLTFANLCHHYEGVSHKVETRLIVGCKAWHLGEPEYNPYKYAFAQALATIPNGATVIMTPGEIDCRYNEGIYPSCRKRDLPLQVGVDNTVSGYTEYVVAAMAAKSIKPIFWGVPASSMDISALPQEEHTSFLQMIGYYNRSLKKHAEALGACYADVYSLTAGVDGRGNGKYHIEDVHLKPSVLQELL